MQTLRYDDIGTINAVKLLSKINSYNDFIQLTTEIDSHIEEGDIVFITYSGNSISYSNDEIILDNYIYTNNNNNIYSEYSTGYLVINVNKNNNSFVINRKINTIPANKDLIEHYVSKITINNANINNGEINSTFIKNSNVSGNELIWKQGVMCGGDIDNITINNKYSEKYITLNIKYIDSFIKHLNLNNNNFGYSYFFNLSSTIKDTIINFGSFYNCRITSSTISTIYNGYFYKSNIINNKIENGYFEETTLNNCEWLYGKWNNLSTNFNTSWKDGIFINGIFDYNNIWEYGTFLNGIFRGIWKNGIFNNGIFKSSLKQGEFNGGILSGNSNTTIYNCNINGGIIENTIISDSNLKNGNIKNSTIKNSIISNNIIINKCNMFNNNYISGTITETNFFNNNFNNTDIKIENSIFYSNNIINGGNFKNNIFKNQTVINNGDFYNNLFKIDKNTKQQCKIKTITLLSGTTSFKNIIYAELIGKNHFTSNDANSIVTLSGFENNNLNGNFNISNLTEYNDPTSYNGVFSTFPSIGENYILLGQTNEIYSNEIGIITKQLYENTSKNIINNGNFEKDEFVESIINNGVFINTYMHSATTFNQGQFNGGVFSSTELEQNNIWYGGDFFNGDFGLNINNNKDIYTILDNVNTKIISNSISGHSNIFIENIYPRLYDKIYKQLLDITISSSTMLNYKPWNDINSTQIIALPYELIFKINCNSNKILLMTWLNNSNNNISIVDLEKTISNPLNGDGVIYKDFNDIYDNGYIYKDYFNDYTSDFIYLRFQSEKIKNLYNQSILYEINSYVINYKNIWSIANTGYYTHPLPVLTSIEDNTSKVTNYTINGNNTDWIYGTSVPPWILNKTPYVNFHYINWSLLSGVSSNTFTITTPTHFNDNIVKNYNLNINNLSTPQELKTDLSLLHNEFIDIKNSTLNIPYNNTFLDWMTYHSKYRNNSGDTSFGYSGSTLGQNILEDISNWSGSSGWTKLIEGQQSGSN